MRPSFLGQVHMSHEGAVISWLQCEVILISHFIDTDLNSQKTRWINLILLVVGKWIG